MNRCAVSKSAQFRTHSTPSSTRRRLDRPGAPSVRACVPVCGVVCLASGTACAAPCRAQSFRVRCGLGSPPAGYIAAAQPRPVSSAKNLQNKKGVFPAYPPPLFCTKHLTPIVNLKNFPQKQKDPYKGSAFCAILALQALKGRNLQKCTPYLE